MPWQDIFENRWRPRIRMTIFQSTKGCMNFTLFGQVFGINHSFQKSTFDFIRGVLNPLWIHNKQLMHSVIKISISHAMTSIMHEHFFRMTYRMRSRTRSAWNSTLSLIFNGSEPKKLQKAIKFWHLSMNSSLEDFTTYFWKAQKKKSVGLCQNKRRPVFFTSFSFVYTSFRQAYLPYFVGYVFIMTALSTFTRPPWVPTPGRWHNLHWGQTPRRHLFRRILYWLLFWTQPWIPPKSSKKCQNISCRLSWLVPATLAVASRLFFCSCHRSRRRRLKGHKSSGPRRSTDGKEKPFSHREGQIHKGVAAL